MKNLLYILLFCSLLNTVIAKDRWPAHHFRRKISIENKKQAPDVNTYEWLRYIYKQCPDITLNKQISDNVMFYHAVILNSTEKTTVKLNRYVQRWGKFLLGILASAAGCVITIKGIQKYANDLDFNIKSNSDKDLLINIFKNITVVIIGMAAIPSFLTSIKIYKGHFKLKKTLETNKKMLAAINTAIADVSS